MAKMYDLFGQNSTAEMLRYLKKRCLNAHELLRLKAEEQAYRQRFTRSMDKAGVDVLIGPTSTSAAFPKNAFYANFSLFYTGMFNLLGLPAGVVPVSRVRKDESNDALFLRVRSGMLHSKFHSRLRNCPFQL